MLHPTLFHCQLVHCAAPFSVPLSAGTLCCTLHFDTVSWCMCCTLYCFTVSWYTVLHPPLLHCQLVHCAVPYTLTLSAGALCPHVYVDTVSCCTVPPCLRLHFQLVHCAAPSTVSLSAGALCCTLHFDTPFCTLQSCWEGVHCRRPLGIYGQTCSQQTAHVKQSSCLRCSSHLRRPPALQPPKVCRGAGAVWEVGVVDVLMCHCMCAHALEHMST